jgi:hypothetical protein
MTIRFETTIEHMVAFSRYHHAHSPTTRQQRWLVALLFPAILFGLAGVRTWYDLNNDFGDPMIFVGDWVAIWTFTLVFSVSWILFSQWNFPRTLEKNLHKMLAEGSNQTALGWRELELVKNRLIVDTKWMHIHLDLRAIDKIVSDGDYTYVYITSVQAYVIPMNLYPEDEYRVFVAELRAAWEHRNEATDDLARGSVIVEDRIVERRF